MTRHEYFLKRLEEIKAYSEASPYNSMVGKCVEELSVLFQEQGHSGYSASLTVEIFGMLHKEWVDRTPRGDRLGTYDHTHLRSTA